MWAGPAHVVSILAAPSTFRTRAWRRYAGGLSAREIGLVLGKSEAAIQKQIQRALAALREVLE